MSEKKNVTFDDIAEYTHFSKTTISRYFNHPDSVTQKNQEKIRAALEALGYKENKVAKILAKGKTEFVGIIIPNLYLHYFSEILNRILNTYEEYGYKFLVFVGGQDKEAERKYIRELISYQIEGLIVMSHTLSSKELAALPVPVVTIEREDQYVSSVNCDNYMGAAQAVSLLSKRGCDILIHVNTTTPENIPAYQRIVGFQDFCNEMNLEHEVMICHDSSSYEIMYESLESVFEEIERKYPDKKKGIFFSNDTLANCFLNVLLRHYKTLPPQYKLVGFDNSPIASSATYSISTIGQQIDVIAHEAVAQLDAEIQAMLASPKGPKPDIVHKVITPILCRRETTEMDEA